MGGEGFQGAAEAMAAHHAPRHPIHADQLHHLSPGEELHPPRRHLPHQRLVGAIEQLLAGLAAGVEGAAHQGAAEAAVGQGAAVLAGEGHPLGHALIDDRAADFRQAVAAGLAGAEIAALQRVAEEAADAVAVTGVVLGGVDAPLGRHRMGPPRAVVISDQLHPVALLSQGGGGRGAGQAAAHHQHPQLALVGRADQGQALTAALPGRIERARRQARLKARRGRREGWQRGWRSWGSCGRGSAAAEGAEGEGGGHGMPAAREARSTRAIGSTLKAAPRSRARARPAQRIRSRLPGSSQPRLRWALSLPCSR